MKNQGLHPIRVCGWICCGLVAFSVWGMGCNKASSPPVSDSSADGDAGRQSTADEIRQDSSRGKTPAGTGTASNRERPETPDEPVAAEDSATVVTIAPTPAQNGAAVAEPNDSSATSPADEQANISTGQDPARNPPVDGASGVGKTPQPIQIELAQPPYQPEVFFSEQHAKTNLVSVGDPMPEIQLPDLDGEPRKLPELYGQRMTVVLFWTNGVFAAEEFARLNSDVADTFAVAGVNVVAINVGDSPEIVTPMIKPATGRVVNLLDQDRQAFATVATDHLPRVYLLDSDGKILWFDIEYSRSTRRELRNAIVYHLQQANLLQANDG